MPSPDNPFEGMDMTALQTLAAQVHEMYTAYVAAGFSEPQALYLTASFGNGNPGPAPHGEGEE